ncbi:MAG TPA: hypothetical protein VFA18_04675 [Gemmataceae bacterium]|nr:hypothetical protein [Gemmataceae bacterium]
MRYRILSLMSPILLTAVTGCLTHSNCVTDDSSTVVQCGSQRLHVHVTVDPPETVTKQPEAAVEGQRLLAVDEQNKALLARVHELEAALQQKEQVLAQTNGQVQTASQEVVRAREELQRLKQNIGVLRDRLSASEKENLNTLQTIVSSLEEGTQPPSPTQGPAPPATPRR